MTSNPCLQATSPQITLYVVHRLGVAPELFDDKNVALDYAKYTGRPVYAASDELATLARLTQVEEPQTSAAAIRAWGEVVKAFIDPEDARWNEALDGLQTAIAEEQTLPLLDEYGVLTDTALSEGEMLAIAPLGRSVQALRQRLKPILAPVT